MAGNFTRQAETALKLITKNGQPLAFSRIISAFDPVTGGLVVPATALPYQGQGVRLPSYKGTVFEAMDSAFKSALITGKATVLLVAAKSLLQEPTPGDEVMLADGSLWSIVGLTVLNPSGAPIIYTMGVVAK